jgi:hypothetical protein
MVVAASADAATCLQFASHPDGTRLAEVATADSMFAVTYVHSVTRTPVTERYGVDGDTIVQTEIRFAQHGPGLPTQPDAGGTFEQRDGQLTMTLDRRFPAIVMRVNHAQSPRLAVDTRTFDLAAWGDRAIVVRAQAGPCAAGIH